MMRKHRPREVRKYSLQDAAVRAVLLTAVTLLCFYSALWMMQDVFPAWVISKKAADWICALVLITVFLYETGIRALPRCRMLCGFFLFALYAAVIIRYIKKRQIDFEDGACALAVQFLEKYNKQMKTSYSIWQGKPELLGASFALLVLAAVLGLLLLTLIFEKRVFLLLFPAAVLSAELMVGYAPQWKGVSHFCAALLLLSADAVPSVRSRRHVLRAHSSAGGTAPALLLQRWLPVYALLAAAAVFLAVSGVIFKAPAGRIMEKSPGVLAFQRQLERNLQEFASSFFIRQSEDITNSPRSYTGREVMQVTVSAEPQGDVLLKGFQGAQYQNGSWSSAQEAYADACADAGMTQEAAARLLLEAEYRAFAGEESGQNGNADGRLSYLESDPQAVDGEPVDYTITYTGIHSRFAYLPYTVHLAESPDAEKTETVGDATVLKPRRLGQLRVHGWNHKMNLTAIRLSLWGSSLYGKTDGAQAGGAAQDDMEWYDAFVSETYLAVPEGMPTLDEYFDTLIDPETMHVLASDSTVNPQFRIQDNKTGKNLLLRSIIQELKAEMETKYYSSSYYFPDRYFNIYYRWNMANLIWSALTENLSYNLHPKELAQGEDAVRYFLLESHEGYCVHFASAAVFLLRELGVPARYVSGYAARREDFHADGDGAYTASVKDRSAHAWVEIYLDRAGWVPVDVTPGDALTQNAAQPQASGENDTGTEDTKADDTKTDDTKTDDTKTEDTETETDAETEADGEEAADKKQDGAMGRAGRILRGLLCLGAACLCGFLIRLAVRRYHAAVKTELSDGRYRSAVCRLNRRIYRKLLRQGKIRRHSMTDAQYEQLLGDAFSNISKEQWARYMRIVKEAAFSGAELSKEDAFFCSGIYDSVCGIK